MITWTEMTLENVINGDIFMLNGIEHVKTSARTGSDLIGCKFAKAVPHGNKTRIERTWIDLSPLTIVKG